MNKTFSLVDAIQSLYPSAQWVLTGDNYSGLEWLSDDTEKPTEDALVEEYARLQAEHDALEYQRLRSSEYPPMADYLDGIVKNDQDQIDKYIADCQAVKDKYPKPSV